MYGFDDGFEEWEGSTGGKINDGNVHEIKFEVRQVYLYLGYHSRQFCLDLTKDIYFSYDVEFCSLKWDKQICFVRS